MFFTKTARRTVATYAGTLAIAGLMVFGAAANAVADPPNCTAADLAQVSSRVSAATSDYLFAHPDVNAFFTGLKGQPRNEVSDDVQNYLNANPQVQAELQVVRQPLIDFRNGCGVSAPESLAPAPGSSESAPDSLEPAPNS